MHAQPIRKFVKVFAAFRKIWAQSICKHRAVITHSACDDRIVVKLESLYLVPHLNVPEYHLALSSCGHEELVVLRVELHTIHWIKVICYF